MNSRTHDEIQNKKKQPLVEIDRKVLLTKEKADKRFSNNTFMIIAGF